MYKHTSLVDIFQRKIYKGANQDILLLLTNQAQVHMMDIYNHLM